MLRPAVATIGTADSIVVLENRKLNSYQTLTPISLSIPSATVTTCHLAQQTVTMTFTEISHTMSYQLVAVS